MKPITEEQRQQLIALARIEISRWKLPPDKQYMVDLMEIALASLTAEKVMCSDEIYSAIEGIQNRHYYEAGRYGVLKRHSGIGEDGMSPVYTVPPVPVIKLPEYQKLLAHPAVKSRWNECIDEVKRLNGLED